MSSERFQSSRLEKNENHNKKKIKNKPDNKRQQTTTVDYKRLINGSVLTNSVTLQHQIIQTMEYCISKTMNQHGEVKKTSGLLPNCRVRNRLPAMLRNLQQKPIKRQAQTVLYPMFPNAKNQLFHNMQVLWYKIHRKKNRHNVKNHYLCPFN